MTTWIYLSDLAPKARILNPETGELREIMQSAVKNKAPIGLRRYCLEELPGGSYQETGALADLTPTLVEDMLDHSVKPNSWNFDFADYAFESASDPAELDRVKARLEREMADYPYTFEITGLQRRFLLYFSDGNVESQQAFEALLPTPETSPLRADGTLRRPFAFTYNHLHRDAKAPWPRHEERLYGGLRPCLYRGPAYVVRFLLDGQDVLLERCRVYVDPKGNFICSDWCQRHDYSSYSNGINLQMGIYTFSTWVTGPCLVKNGDNFTPKNTTFERTAIRDMLKRHVLIPTFDETLAKATKKIALVSKALPPKPVVADAGPITADIMAEAMAAAQAVFAAAPPTPSTPDTPTVTDIYRVPFHEWPMHATPSDPDSSCGYVIRMKQVGGSNEHPIIEARQLTWVRDDYQTVPITDELSEYNAPDDVKYFVVDDASTTGFWYGDDADDQETLSSSWWLHSAAQYYRTHLFRSPLETVLQGT